MQVLLGYQMYRTEALTLCCGQKLDLSSMVLHTDTVCLWFGWVGGS